MEMAYLRGAQVRNTTVGKEVQEARENRRVKYEWKILITTGDRSSGERYSREGLGESEWHWFGHGASAVCQMRSVLC